METWRKYIYRKKSNREASIASDYPKRRIVNGVLEGNACIEQGGYVSNFLAALVRCPLDLKKFRVTALEDCLCECWVEQSVVHSCGYAKVGETNLLAVLDGGSEEWPHVMAGSSRPQYSSSIGTDTG